MLFPIGIATGEAFCNRENERKILKDNINANRHTVLLAPRRYGKANLVSEVIKQLSYPSCCMDFLLAADARSVEAAILERVGELLQSILPRTKKTAEKTLTIFRQLRPEITLSSIGQKIVLHSPSENTNNRETTICDVLLNLDKTAQAAKKRVIVFMDEFQQIGQLRDKHVIEASIRHAVERSKSVSYIFSGSNRHLLLQMFSDKNRPFYRLCTTISLKRISKSDHVEFIQKHAEKKWHKALKEETMNTILKLSECHPYYVKLICSYFWQNDEYPTSAKVVNFWNSYIETQKPIIAYDLALLSNNQKTILKDLAEHPANQPYSNENLLRTRLTIASQKEAIKKLLLKDFLFQDEFGFIRLLDPAVSSYVMANFVHRRK